MLLPAVFLIVLLLYFWFWTGGGARLQPAPGGQQPAQASNRLFTHKMDTVDGREVLFKIDDEVHWQFSLTDLYSCDKGRIFARDVCYGAKDGDRVPATGKLLYDYLRNNKVSLSLPVFADKNTLQHGSVFYFTCKNNHIESVNTCPSGQVFAGGSCHSINLCLGKQRGTTFANAYNPATYYKCPGGDAPAQLEECPDQTWFVHDACRSDVGETLCNEDRQMLVDAKTLFVCEKGKATFRICPEGQEYFLSPRCESSRCVGHADGTRLPLAEKADGPFRFSTGYIVCNGQRVERVEECPSSWNTNEASDQLIHLPQVFDGSSCSAPIFCTNVRSDDPDIIVPTYNFTKLVKNWRFSADVDSVTGVSCVGATRKRRRMDPGDVVDLQTFKRSKSSSEKTFVADRFDLYVDSDGKVVTCPPGQQFDGTRCNKITEPAFIHDSLKLFRFDNDEFSWNYSKEPEVKCTEPESVFLSTYNACSHPDCTLFPFLSIVPFSIATKDKGYECRAAGKTIQKKETLRDVNYWTQSDTDTTPCVPGQRVRSGHFVMDSTLYATCDERQPFVFCPSANTLKIELVEGKRWACVPDTIGYGILRARETRTFQPNELRTIRSVSPRTRIFMNGHGRELTTKIVVPENQRLTLTAGDDDLILGYRYQQTFPPDVVFEDGQPRVSNLDAGGAFMMKVNGFTAKPVEVPTFDQLVATLTGRVVFAILILLTCGLTVFVMNAIQTSTANLAATGKWFQSTFASALEKLKGLSSSSASPEREKVS